MHFHSAALDVFVLVRAVDKHRELFGSDLLCPISEHKQHRIYHIGLPAAIWTNDTGKSLEEEKKWNVVIMPVKPTFFKNAL